MIRTNHTNRTATGLACLFFLAGLSGPAGNAEAQSIEPAGVIQAVAVDPHRPANVFAAGNGRVYRSVDNGRNWAESGDVVMAWSLAVKHIDLEGDPAGTSMVFAGTQDSGVMRSLDGGQTWVADPLFTEEIRRVAIHPNDNSVWAGSEQAIYVSHDSGANWEVVADNLGAGHVHGIAFNSADRNNVYVAKWNQGVYATIDGGQSWWFGNNGLTDTQIFDLDIDPSNPAVLYVSTTSGIFQSVDAGANWSSISGPTLVNEMAISRIDSSYLYVATENNGLYRSRDGGLTWQTATPDGVTAFTSIGTAVDGTEHVYAGSVNDGLFISDNSGLDWMTVSEFAGTTPRPVTPPSGDSDSAAMSMNIVDLQNGESVPSGGVARFRITIRNEGPAVATDVAFEAFWVQLHIVGGNDPMPFTITASQGSCPTSSDCFFGDLPAGAERTIEFSGTTEAGALNRYRLYAHTSASNVSQFQQTAEIGASVTVLSSDGGGGSTGLITLISLLLILSGRGFSRVTTHRS